MKEPAESAPISPEARLEEALASIRRIFRNLTDEKIAAGTVAGSGMEPGGDDLLTAPALVAAAIYRCFARRGADVADGLWRILSEVFQTDTGESASGTGVSCQR